MMTTPFRITLISMVAIQPILACAQTSTRPKRITWVGIETFETAYRYSGRNSGVLGYANDYSAKTVINFTYVQESDTNGNSRFVSEKIAWSSHGQSVADGYEATTCDGSGEADVLGHDNEPIKIQCETDSYSVHWGFFPHPPSSVSPPRLVSWDQLRNGCVYSEEDYGTYSRHTYTVSVCGTGKCNNSSIQMKITAPPNNGLPSDTSPDSDFSFLARRGFADTATADTIPALASVTSGGDPSTLTWGVTPTVGGIRNETPQSKKGSSFSFVPNPPPEPPYKKENGSYARSAPLSYTITATLCGVSDAVTVAQDQKDIIIQEYVSHGLPLPARSELHPPVATTHFTTTELDKTAYSLILGDPGPLAEAVRAAYNTRIEDDVQVVPVGAPVKGGQVVVRSGAYVDSIGPILDTQPCNAAPNPATCLDVVALIFSGSSSESLIIAGQDGIVQTKAINQTTDSDLDMGSGWRNPKRNEAVGGVLTSRHQFGNAIDLIPQSVPGKSSDQLFCILETAARSIGATAFAEHNASPRSCNEPDVDHIHVQK